MFVYLCRMDYEVNTSDQFVARYKNGQLILPETGMLHFLFVSMVLC